MKKANFVNLKSSIIFLVWLILIIYCFLIFIPLPFGISIGLDPSWQYAISRAAADKLIFGKDIVFTYGPLGYLIAGAAWEQNLWLIAGFRFAVYLALFILGLVKILKLKTNIQKICLASGLLLPHLAHISIDYQIVFIFIIILSDSDVLPRSSTRYWSLSMGVFAGFCLLTKFTLGICIFASIILFLLANCYNSINSNSDIELRFFALIDAFLAAVSLSFILLHPDFYLSNFKQVIIFLAIAGASGVISWLIQQWVNSKALLKIEQEINNNHILSMKYNSKVINWCIFYVIYVFYLFNTIFHSSPSLIDYLKGCLEISSGYSSAMSIIGEYQILGLAISELVLISVILIVIALEGSLGFALALFFILILTFKHGFVRQDIHVMAFVWCIPMIVAICIPKIKAPRFQKFSYLLYGCSLILITQFVINPSLGFPSFTSGRVATNLSSLLVPFNLTAIQSNLNAKSNANLAIVKLPEKVIELLKNKKIDIIPWEVSLVAANKLNWKPRPVFQSYSAYTTYLDDINYESLSTEPRDYILYNFISIDGRHPFFDEPKSFSYVFCNYKISNEIPEFINTPTIFNLMILEKRKLSICSASSLANTLSTSWNTSHVIEASDQAITRAKVKFSYSTFGKIYKTFFRSPPVLIEVNYLDGTNGYYRIIPENSENGIVISHLPTNPIEAMLLFKGELKTSVKSFSFHAINSLLYQQNIEINFLSSKLLNSSIK